MGEGQRQVDMVDVNEPSAVKRAADAVMSAVGSTVQDIKDTANVFELVRVRLEKRYKYLKESSKWTRTKETIAKKIKWTDHPPKLCIGDIEIGINGSVATITYVEYLKDEKTGGPMRSVDGGWIVTHYVEETLAQGKLLKQERTAVEGAPTYKEAKKAWEDKYTREAEKKRRR